MRQAPHGEHGITCTCTLPAHSSNGHGRSDPRAPTEHIGSERAHARGLPAMIQLCSQSMSRPAQIKDQLVLDDEEGRRRDDWSGLRTASGRATPIADSPCCLRHEHQLVLRVGGSNHPHPVVCTRSSYLLFVTN